MIWKKGHPYLSQKMQQEFQTKFEWSRMRHEVFVMEGIQLLDAILVEAENEDGDDRDYIWYLIHGKMIDYVYHEETGELLKGSRKMEDFFEILEVLFWKMETGCWMRSARRKKWIMGGSCAERCFECSNTAAADAVR